MVTLNIQLGGRLVQGKKAHGADAEDESREREQVASVLHCIFLS